MGKCLRSRHETCDCRIGELEVKKKNLCSLEPNRWSVDTLFYSVSKLSGDGCQRPGKLLRATAHAHHLGGMFEITPRDV